MIFIVTLGVQKSYLLEQINKKAKLHYYFTIVYISLDKIIMVAIANAM